MKKYMAIWGGLFFFVICVSLYLMLETLSSSPGRYASFNGESVLTYEKKINQIQTDIDRNRKTIDEIRAAVRKLSAGDEASIDRLKKILDRQNKQLESDVKKLNNLKSNHESILPKEEGVVVNMDSMGKGRGQPPNKGDISKGKSYPVAGSEVKVSQDMCTWSASAKAHTEVKMDRLFETLPFDNPDGGVWKQGWDVTYPSDAWTAEKKLKVFVVPHSHNDPGWVKTFEEYYKQQTKHILTNAVKKLEEYPYAKFIYAEISFFHMWWNEQDSNMRQRVKKLMDAGRYEIVTGGWVMNDEANTHYFAMIDQLIEGHQWLEGTLGVKPQSSWAIDPFGHSPTMAYILRRSGFNGMLVQRIHYAIKKHLAKHKQLEFMWRQSWDKDGLTDMLCHMMPFYSYDVPHTCGPEPAVCCQFDFRRLPGSSYNCPWRVAPQVITDSNIVERTNTIIDQWKKKASLYRSQSLFIPLGDDFRYDKEDEWDKQFTNYKRIFDYLKQNPQLGVEAQFGTLSDYFNSLYNDFKAKPGEKPGDYPVLNGDFFSYADKDDHYWSGYFTSRPFYKNIDRLMEGHLRASEILFSLASARARRDSLKNFPVEAFMKKLIDARRVLGLFQHHDGVTGTAKDFVVVDYGNKLLTALRDTKVLIKECATFLTLDTKKDYEFTDGTPLYNVDDVRESHDSLPEHSILTLGEDGAEPRAVMFYNSLGQDRDQTVNIYVDHPHVIVRDSLGNTVLSQVNPVWVDPKEISASKYEVSFRLVVPALGILRYTVGRLHKGANSQNIFPSVQILNSNSDVESAVFSVSRGESTDFKLESPYFTASFSGSNGLLTSVHTKEDGGDHEMRLEFVTYGTSNHHGDKSGAYLFLPDGQAKPMKYATPIVHVIKGPIVSQVTVMFELVRHVVRVYNSTGVDGLSLDVHNTVDIRQTTNYELVTRIVTDVKNTDHFFYTDLNGFQMQKHKYYEKLTLQGNFYPMPTMAFIEDDQHRFSVLSSNSLGFANLKPGVVEIVLDRRLNQDDSRGLGHGVVDNKQTPSQFRLLFEKRVSGSVNTADPTTFASLLAQQTSLQLLHPVHVIPAHPSTVTLPKQSSFIPMQSSLPCDIHLLNLRTMQNRDDGPQRLVPKETAGLFLHRLGVDCGFRSHGLTCGRADGNVILNEMFSEVHMSSANQVSLTLMYDEEETDTSATLNLEPMEIASYVVHLQ